ncbi:AraC family transcriptional regulator [Paenibacillus sp. LHD-117]|uniref:helix-turn-helix transcriptional regulator n=1 Tax=Paenibacillus sp. LHD-117 TaxID=3071412 RepID=UPI0027DF044D|nr:AraC family transcriptional regulator [Paenibacillus sp. LHD-117]MDQ6422844.1 AraC family transcriptional regulator [Paenibacillus sp. LHD-117]
MPDTVTYGNEEEGPFYMQHIRRTGPFERTQHMHEMYELYYLYEGERLYFIRDRSYLILPGDLVLINRRDLHATSDSGDFGHARVVVNFSDLFLEGAMQEAPFLLDAFTNGSPVLRLDLPTRRAVEHILGKMTAEVKEHSLGQSFALRHFLIELLLYAARFARVHPATPLDHVSPLHRKISSIVRHINTSYTDEIRLEELARRFEISPAYLSRMFKEVTGFSLVSYINFVRIQAAQRLLAESNEKVITIAEQVGFGSLVQFGRAFRQIAKTTPLRYRQLSRG